MPAFRPSSIHITTLSDPFLTEIGRIIAQHGVLLYQVREFVSDIASKLNLHPLSVSSKGSIQLLPSVFETVMPIISSSNRCLFQQALDSVNTANKTVSRFLWSSWSTMSSGADVEFVTRVEYRKNSKGGCWMDREMYSTQELRQISVKISDAIAILIRVHGALKVEFSKSNNALKHRK